MRRSTPSDRCRMVHLLLERRLGSAEQRSDLAGADAEGLGDLDVAQAAVAEREHRGRLRGQPAQGLAEVAAVLAQLHDVVRVLRAVQGGVEGGAPQLALLAAPAAP